MKVLIAHVRNDIVSGAEYAILDMVSAKPADFEFVMLVPGRGKLGDFYEKSGIPVIYRTVTGPRRKYPGYYSVSSLLFSFFLRRHKFDLVLCNTFAASFRVSLGTKLAKKKLVIYTREYYSKVKKLNSKQLKRADAMFVVSNDVKNYIDTQHEKVFVCNDTIDIDSILSRINAKKAGILDHELKNVGYVGRITSYKQPDLFIKSIPWVLKKYPGVQFHIIGTAIEREKKLADALPMLAEELGVLKNVVFWGHRSDAVEIISELDVFCLTSDREPFPRTILEAMLARTPVVASDTGGCREMINDGETGLFYNVADEKAWELLAEKILKYLQEPEFAKLIANNAYNYVQNKFGRDEQKQNFISAIRAVAD